MRVLCPTIPSGKTAHGPTRWVNCQSPERHEEWCLLAAGEERRRGEGRKDASRSSGTGVAHLLLPIRASSFWKRPKVTSLLLPERNRSVPTASFGKNRIGKPWLLISIELFIPKFGTAAFWHWLEQKLVGNPCLSPHSARGQKCREGEGGEEKSKNDESWGDTTGCWSSSSSSSFGLMIEQVNFRRLAWRLSRHTQQTRCHEVFKRGISHSSTFPFFSVPHKARFFLPPPSLSSPCHKPPR